MIKEKEKTGPKFCSRNRNASYWTLFLLVVVMFVLMATPLFAYEKNNTQIKLVLRYDDYRLCNPTKVDNQMLEIAIRHNLSITIGVVPFLKKGIPTEQRSEQRCDEILASGVARGKFEVAQHGYDHSLYQVTYYRQGSEFVGRSYSEQLSMIKAGRHAIENALGVKVASFIPPWNSYDDVTVESLRTLGFKVLSAHAVGQGWSSCIPKPVPVTCELVDLRKAIEEVRQRKEGEIYIVGLFHDFYFKDVDPIRGKSTMQDFEELVIWLTAQPDIEIMTVSEAAQRNTNFTGHNQKSVARLFFLKSLIPNFLQKSQWGYPNTSFVKTQQLSVFARIIFFTFFIFGVTAILTWAIFLVVSDGPQTLSTFLTWALIVFTLFLFFYGFKDRFFNINRMSAIAVGVGIIAALLAKLASRFRNKTARKSTL
ncbi:MAG: DUF2334 domain-containing protein [Syntrophaceae bacterium]